MCFLPLQQDFYSKFRHAPPLPEFQSVSYAYATRYWDAWFNPFHCTGNKKYPPLVNGNDVFFLHFTDRYSHVCVYLM